MVFVIGEALIDLVLDADGAAQGGSRNYTAHPGGSPYNVAIGLARLGQPTQLLARLAQDAFGRQLRWHAVANGVDVSSAVNASEPSTLAVVGLDEDQNAIYDFYLNGTADWQWTDDELVRLPVDVDWVHTGSLASWTAPGAARIEARLAALRSGSGQPIISYDPNVRPALMPDRDAAVAVIERLVALSDVVKASAEDLAWMYPERAIADALVDWRALGASVVVVTDGGQGAHAVGSDGETFTVPAPRVSIVDTVGAGDAFMAGLINALARTGLLAGAIAAESLRPVIEEAALVAALTCQRAGANPPTAAELSAALQR
jgi:fructokinase